MTAQAFDQKAERIVAGLGNLTAKNAKEPLARSLTRPHRHHLGTEV
jgi:hypothetical protein